MTFRDLLEGKNNETISSIVVEEIGGINNTNVGALIVDTIVMIAQSHAWHLVTRSGQKHTALNEFYTELQDEVDELAERFIAQGGILPQRDFSVVTNAEPDYILERVQGFRNNVSYCASQCQSAEMASILDGVVNIQRCVDSFVYKFKLD